jgi:hypothetical protein
MTTEQGNGKLPGYFPIYDRHLGKFRNTAANVLEIGVSSGSSLKLWKDFFGPDACIAGIDNDASCAQHDDPGYVKVYTGDQSDLVFLERVCREAGPFDVVIDDGSHTAKDVRLSFDFLYPKLGRHGVYLVEDTHTQYRNAPQYLTAEGVALWGPVEVEQPPGLTFLEYAKNLTDALNLRYFSDWQPNFDNDFIRNTRSVHFYESVVVFERGRSPVYKTWTGRPKGS